MSPSFPFQLKKYEETIMNVHDELVMSPSFLFHLKYEETIMNVHERWISDGSFQLKTYEETIMNVHERWISDQLIMNVQIWRDYYECIWTMRWVHLFHFKLKHCTWTMKVISPTFPYQLKTYEETIMNDE